MRNNQHMMLGRVKSRYDARTLTLHSFIDCGQEVLPEVCKWQNFITTWGKMGNDRYGNCVIVTKAHMIMTWESNSRKKDCIISDLEVINESRNVGALNGYNILDSMKEWRKRGYFGDKIWAFASLMLTDPSQVRSAVHYLGGIELGVNLPEAWKGADVWDTGTGRRYSPGTWGGHSVPIVGYDLDYVYVVSWGEIIPMTWSALTFYCDEAYTAIDSNWLTISGKTPSGFDLELLHEKLNRATVKE